MECARCGEATVDTPCRVCGEDPRLDGRYRLLEPIGRGASGNTWRARDERTGQVVAIKEMLLSRASSAKTRELWEREVRVLQQLDHPQIPRYVDSFEAGRGRTRSLCLVQELVEGRTLEEEMRRRRYSEDDALAVARGLAPVLDYLHGLQPPVVHRDLKPSNVIRARDGRLVLIDFGAVRDALADAQLGGSTVAGTFGYMAPEQFRGDAGPATDAYALGGLLVTLLTRMPPHRLLDPRGHLVWQPHCRVSPATAHLVDSLLQADPADRPTGAFEMERTLALGPP
ncbi:MAG: serine/threonine protein kinase, partial [Myxococcales bacterium]|nr:serine/threonine protein kinase [Myxococcales bacterium]